MSVVTFETVANFFVLPTQIRVLFRSIIFAMGECRTGKVAFSSDESSTDIRPGGDR